MVKEIKYRYVGRKIINTKKYNKDKSIVKTIFFCIILAISIMVNIMQFFYISNKDAFNMNPIFVLITIPILFIGYLFFDYLNLIDNSEKVYDKWEMRKNDN